MPRSAHKKINDSIKQTIVAIEAQIRNEEERICDLRCERNSLREHISGSFTCQATTKKKKGKAGSKCKMWALDQSDYCRWHYVGWHVEVS